jgi:cytochrome b6-f complex iron-sulfur subunit
LGGLVRFLNFQPDPPKPSLYNLGLASNYPPESRTPIPKARAVVVHTENGFVALSLICPHLGCTVSLASDGYTCPCHGSRFNLEGSVQNGPASKPMTILKIGENAQGELILHTGS